MNKTTLFLHLLTLFVISYVFGEDFLSKFHQDVYKIRNFRVEVGAIDKNWSNKFEAATFKYNRTIAVINVTFNFKVDVEDNLLVLQQYYKKTSNGYRRFPVRYQLRMANAFDADVAGIQKLTKCGNVSKMYFFKDVTYHICNFFVDDTKLPPLIPIGEYKAKCDFKYLDHILGTLNVYIEIYIPMKYPKN